MTHRFMSEAIFSVTSSMPISSSVQDLLGQQGAVVELEAKHGPVQPVQQSKGIPATHQVVGVEAGVVLTKAP